MPFVLPDIHLSDTSEERVAYLTERVRLLTAFAEAQERWEAEALLSDGDWFDEMPDKLMTGLENLQELRNQALGR